MRQSEQVPTFKKIGIRFKHFKKEMYDIWESYCLVGFYFPIVHEEVKRGRIPPLRFKSLKAQRLVSLTPANTFGAISHILRQANGRNALITSVAAFEYCIADLATYVYRDFPKKLV